MGVWSFVGVVVRSMDRLLTLLVVNWKDGYAAILFSIVSSEDLMQDERRG